MKLELNGDEWLIIAETLVAHGRDVRSPAALDLAARILRALHLPATALAIEAENDRLMATVTPEKETP